MRYRRLQGVQPPERSGAGGVHPPATPARAGARGNNVFDPDRGLAGESSPLASVAAPDHRATRGELSLSKKPDLGGCVDHPPSPRSCRRCAQLKHK
jgi:hypothetical protein